MLWPVKTKKKKIVLFLCTGDTCRGPMASGFMRFLLEERGIREIEVRSAGVMTATGLLATQEAQQLLSNAGVDISRHKSSQLTPELIRRADLILGMTPFHVQFALRMAQDQEDAKDKIHLFKEYVGADPKNYQITDPMGHTLEVYKRVFREIRQACEFLAEKPIITGKSADTRKKAPAKRKASAGDEASAPKSAVKPTTPSRNETKRPAATKAAHSKAAAPPREKSAKPKPVAKSAAKPAVAGKSSKPAAKAKSRA